MKDPFVRTKVVLRHLPPTLSHSALTEQLDSRFAHRYKWFFFRPGKNSQKNQKYSRAYIDFKKPEDVVDFAEFFDGHVFVNEKGTQVKAIVEYAPSQRVPKSWCKKDGREGTIFKDPEYLEFLEFLAKPVENLPSAEIQLEKREAERVGASKEPRVTALMDYVRQKRAAKDELQRLSSNGKPSRRAIGTSPGTSRATSSRRGAEKKRYVMKDSTKGVGGKEKSPQILASRRDDPSPSDKPVSVTAESGAESIADKSGASGVIDIGKKTVIILKGKERENANSYAGASQQQSTTSSMRNNANLPAHRQSQRRELGGKMINRILQKEVRQNHSSTAVQSESQMQTMQSEKERRPPRSTNMRSILKDNLPSGSNTACSSDSDFKRAADVIGSDGISINEKQERNTRNKDRPDRSVWSHRRSDGSRGSDENLSLSESLGGMSINYHSHVTGANKVGDDMPDFSGKHRNLSSSHMDMRVEVHNSTRSMEAKTLVNIRSGSSVENGSHRYGRRGSSSHGMKDADGSLYLSEGKPSKRGGGTGYGPHEKQVWVQKSGSGS